MTAPPRPPTLSIVLIDPTGAAKSPPAQERAVAQGRAVEIVRAVGSFDGLAPTFEAAVARCVGDFVYAATPDLDLDDDGWGRLATTLAGDPTADGFRLRLAGLPHGDAWRGRRFRSHERNLESLRFAHIAAPGSLVFRSEMLAAALADLPPDAGSDWWRQTALGLGRVGRVAEVDAAPRRSRLLDGEPPYPSLTATRKARVLILGQIEVSTSLYFDVLEGDPDLDVAFRPLTRLGVDAEALTSADLVVLVRELHRFWDEGVIDFLDQAGTPYVWFVDDNFQVLRREGEASPFYVDARMHAALAGAASIWTSTSALAAARVWLHGRVEVCGPALDPRLGGQAPSPTGPLTVAVPGGDFRLSGLAGRALERLKVLSETQELRVLATEAAAHLLHPALPRGDIVVMPRERSFRQHIRQWRAHSPDVVLHPAGATANAPFKAPTAALVAGYLGAVPVVADEPAYETWTEAHGVLRLSGDGLEVAAARSRDPAWRGDMAGRLQGALEARFGPDDRAQRLSALARRPGARPAGSGCEEILTSAAFNRRRLALRLARLTRRLRDRIRQPG